MPVGISDPKQTIGLAQTTASPQQPVDWSQYNTFNTARPAGAFNYDGSNFDLTNPSDYNNMLMNTEQGGTWAGTDQANFTTNNFNNWAASNADWLKSQGYTGAMPGGGGGAINQDMTTTGVGTGDLEDWLKKNGYQYGQTVKNGTQAYSGVFDRYGKPVGTGVINTGNTGNDPLGFALAAMGIGGFGALAAGGGAGAAAGAPDAMGGSAGTLGAADSQAANLALGAGGSTPGVGVPGFASGTLGADTVNQPWMQQLSQAVADSTATGADAGTSAAWSNGASGLGQDTLSSMAGGGPATDAGVGYAGTGGAPGAGYGTSVGAGNAGWMDKAGQIWDQYSKLFGGAKGIANIVGGIGQYAQQKKQAQGLQDIINQGKVGPDSPYAKQLREELMRQDAKAGRRSDYGSREVQLQAKLAELNSKNAANSIAAYQQQAGANSGALNSLLKGAQEVNWGDLAHTIGGWFGG